MKVHNFRVEAAEGRKLEQLLRAPISNPKQEAETMHWKQHMAFDISKSVPSDIFLSKDIPPKPTDTVSPSGGKVFRWQRMWDISH